MMYGREPGFFKIRYLAILTQFVQLNLMKFLEKTDRLTDSSCAMSVRKFSFTIFVLDKSFPFIL